MQIMKPMDVYELWLTGYGKQSSKNLKYIYEVWLSYTKKINRQK